MSISVRFRQSQKNTVQIGNDALQKAKELQQQSQSRANQEENAIDRFNGSSSVSISSTQPSAGTKLLTGPSSSSSRGNNCQTPLFTKSLVTPDRVSNISPLGTPNRPNRSYVSLTKDPKDSVSKVSLYAPSDVRLVGVSFYIHPLLKIGCGGNSARRAQSVPFGYFQTDTAHLLPALFTGSFCCTIRLQYLEAALFSGPLGLLQTNGRNRIN